MTYSSSPKSIGIRVYEIDIRIYKDRHAVEARSRQAYASMNQGIRIHEDRHAVEVQSRRAYAFIKIGIRIYKDRHTVEVQSR